MDEAFGAVEIGEVEGVIELQARMNGPAAVHEFGLKVRFNVMYSTDGSLFVTHLRHFLPEESLHGICRFPCGLHRR